MPCERASEQPPAVASTRKRHPRVIPWRCLVNSVAGLAGVPLGTRGGMGIDLVDGYLAVTVRVQALEPQLRALLRDELLERLELVGREAAVAVGIRLAEERRYFGLE